MNWGILIVIGIIIIVLEIASQLVRNKKTNEKLHKSNSNGADATLNSTGAVEPEEEIYSFYRRKYLFTKNEFYFYKQLQKISEEKNLIPLAKVRLADFVEVTSKSDYMKYFAKIRSKHIDFLLLDKETLKIVVAIELDDNSHSNEKDEFKNKLFEQINIPLIRCKGIGTVEEQLQTILANSNC
ncbi:DUF2726 domain-containing protein [Ruminococcus sp. FMB-CY1]|uniref:DUF2726 domain-containing protein n=1 Tax=unclassified Ruminococcus TaxID=2608920 RepID=UPI00208E82A7|nr:MULTISPECIES: DUF2726 domain-containing protein [unclassified Ruminococcus]USP69808.1 DUF2726 domain-containing protein [Ruminococcus sp. FMBCY1]WBX56883.1 DUF2726 domain-containing protein [Ruminococcus sp. FMB-CY1]